MTKSIDIEFDLGDMVYLKTDVDQNKHVVTGLWVRMSGIEYELSIGTEFSYHFDFEISKEEDASMKFKRSFQ